MLTQCRYLQRISLTIQPQGSSLLASCRCWRTSPLTRRSFPPLSCFRRAEFRRLLRTLVRISSDRFGSSVGGEQRRGGDCEATRQSRHFVANPGDSHLGRLRLAIGRRERETTETTVSGCDARDRSRLPPRSRSVYSGRFYNGRQDSSRFERLPLGIDRVLRDLDIRRRVPTAQLSATTG